ncbi:Ulp1-like peptidase [Cucumis melo var. makuwa]|uniref:Ulp1-like peptidase n=1 Tax=Cucumis melo var. makuwa TaxID=1194695 RepID=A0A5A7T0M5_CUCMM|nr:Ulp1-like peptidase [Cucumis melo var. makuwa]TYK02353.1 Ulp1-like peptidase [Cucumis melo var. makuwa]
MLTMVMTSLNVPPPSAKLQQQNEKEIAYTKVVEKNRPLTCSLDLLDDDEQVNTMVKYATTYFPTIDEEYEKNNWFIHLGTQKTHVLTQVALTVFIETVMVEKDKKTQFDMDILGRVNDEEVFKSYDWLTFFYTRLLNSLKPSLQGKKEAYELKKTKSSKAVAYYNIKGYMLAFQTVVKPKLKLSTQEKALMKS